jgi:hypothetical protein
MRRSCRRDRNSSHVAGLSGADARLRTCTPLAWPIRQRFSLDKTTRLLKAQRHKNKALINSPRTYIWIRGVFATGGSCRPATGWAGVATLLSNTTGDVNTATGINAFRSNTDGIENTATGFGALLGNITGDRNTASGVQALLTNTTGDDNTAIGYAAL